MLLIHKGAKMNKINTVLFDFDGTIMNTNEVIIQSWQHTFRTLTGSEVPVEKILATMGEPLELTMANFFPDVPVQTAVDIYRSWHHDKFDELIQLFPGIYGLLEILKERDYKIGLVTSRLKFTTMKGVNKFGLEKYFDYILTADDTDKHKPDPAPILVALDKIGSVPEESIMVGDTMFDILCARNAGVPSVLVDWSIAVTESQRTGPDAPDYIIKEAKELLHILE